MGENSDDQLSSQLPAKDVLAGDEGHIIREGAAEEQGIPVRVVVAQDKKGALLGADLGVIIEFPTHPESYNGIDKMPERTIATQMLHLVLPRTPAKQKQINNKLFYNIMALPAR